MTLTIEQAYEALLVICPSEWSFTINIDVWHHRGRVGCEVKFCIMLVKVLGKYEMIAERGTDLGSIVEVVRARLILVTSLSTMSLSELSTGIEPLRPYEIQT